MDYTPSPTKVKPQYSFLDDSIEVARKVPSPSPLKPRSKDTYFKGGQRQFYSKYDDLSPRKFGNEKSNTVSSTSTRLFKPLGKEVPLDDDVKINSNMVEKIIRQNEILKQQLKEEKRERELMTNLASSLKEKLMKYKKMNDVLKQDKEDLLNGQKAKVPEFTFNPDDTNDIFESNSKEDAKIFDKDVKNDKIEERITQLEGEISKTKDLQQSKFEFMKNEIEFLKELLLQKESGKEDNDLAPTGKEHPRSQQPEQHTHQEERKEVPGSAGIPFQLPMDDDIIASESEELRKLQEKVALFERKIQLRKENELRKFELKRQLSMLSEELDVLETPASLKTPEETPQGLKTPGQTPQKKPENQSLSKSAVKSTPTRKKTPVIADRLKTTCQPCSQMDNQFNNIECTKWYN